MDEYRRDFDELTGAGVCCGMEDGIANADEEILGTCSTNGAIEDSSSSDKDCEDIGVVESFCSMSLSTCC